MKGKIDGERVTKTAKRVELGEGTENIKHMLIECPSNYNERREMEGEIKKNK